MPPPGKKLVIFIDGNNMLFFYLWLKNWTFLKYIKCQDINMPHVEEYGA